MTEKTATKVIQTAEITVYVADDGMEFETKELCLAHEAETLRKEKEKEMELERSIAFVDRVFTHIPCNDGLVFDADLYVGVLKSEAEYDAIIAWLNCIFEDTYIDINIDKPTQYPTPYVFSITHCAAYTEQTDTEPWEWVTKYVDALAEVRAEMKEI